MSITDFPRYPLTFGPSPVHRLDRLTEHLGGAADLGQAGGRQLRTRLRRQQDPQAGVPGPRRAGQGRRHPGVHRRRAVQPHPAGRRRRREAGPEGRAGAGALGGLARLDQRQGRQHPAVADHGRRRPARPVGLRHRVQGQLAAGAGGRRAGRRNALRDPGRCVRPPARWPRIRQLGVRNAGTGKGSRRLLRHHRGLQRDRFLARRHHRRVAPGWTGRAASSASMPPRRSTPPGTRWSGSRATPRP